MEVITAPINALNEQNHSDKVRKDDDAGKKAKCEPEAKKWKQKDREQEKKSADRSKDCDTNGEKRTAKSPHPATTVSKSDVKAVSQEKRKKTTPTATLSSVSAPVPQKCIGPGCTDNAIDHIRWDNDFCSFRCCSNYAERLFRRWVRRRKDRLVKEAAQKKRVT
jgi:hypothetical protein